MTGGRLSKSKPTMALVDYPSSASESEDPSKPAKRQKTKGNSTEEHGNQAALPPLPSAFHDLYASSARISTNDDPILHGGRKRVTPHIEGNWATHVYLECEWNLTFHNGRKEKKGLTCSLRASFRNRTQASHRNPEIMSAVQHTLAPALIIIGSFTASHLSVTANRTGDPTT